ncbi:MAG: hypothetical protein HY898_01870 [Deltaproteobacteria bacterium]|nr:hypothetical protein [Deltaproteobacteria bacterium]
MKRMRFVSLASVTLCWPLIGCSSSNDDLFAEVVEPPDSAVPEASVPDAALGKLDKLDLLLAIDNSLSMLDKQQILAQAVPDLIERLVNPACVDTDTGLPAAPQMQPTRPLDPCPIGTRREYGPIFDINIGVITSSIGGHGADTCSPQDINGFNPRQADMSHLISRKLANPDEHVATWQSKGFLNWDPTGADKPKGESSIEAIVSAFSQIIEGAGQDGCGYEASLEAWYRFLVDPEPYLQMVAVSCAPQTAPNDRTCRAPEGVDDFVLAYRADFLRPDSMVAILMLTDEDDCSIRDDGPPVGGQYYLAAQGYSGSQPFYLPRATSACATDPSSPSCKSCGQVEAKTDPTCLKGSYGPAEDNLNLRCFNQKQRFGVDFLYPTARYIDALTNAHLPDGRINPLFCGKPDEAGTGCKRALRNPKQIFLQAIVGVPWPDIARDSKDLSKGYRRGSAIPWDVVLGDPDKRIAPKDPLMIQSVLPRKGSNPITGEPIAPPTSTSPKANSVNGHEYDIPGNNDLQYACVFKLPSPQDCLNEPACDCSEPGNSPLCQDESTGLYGYKQYRAKAYPAPRVLSVVKALGDRGGVGSICAPNLANDKSPDFGYRPAILSFIESISEYF